jgi:nitrite reductase/ring-hydroxylating ferredoxin subunit
VRRLREARVRVLPGGDYGFAWTPHGTYAKDLQYFVELFGYTPFDALLAATRDAGEMVGFGGGRVGTLEAGKLADLIVVTGDPTTDVSVLQRRANIAAVMKGGKFYHYALDGRRDGDAYFLLDGRCTHKPEALLAEGLVFRGAIMCLWHGYRYDVTTGRNVHPGTARSRACRCAWTATISCSS